MVSSFIVFGGGGGLRFGESKFELMVGEGSAQFLYSGRCEVLLQDREVDFTSLESNRSSSMGINLFF